MPIVDQMLSVGCIAHIGALHGGTFEVLSGPLVGQNFPYNSNDEVQEVGPEGDLRQTRMLRLTDAVPRFNNPTSIRLDGKLWTITKADFSAYLTHDYRLVEQTTHDT